MHKLAVWLDRSAEHHLVSAYVSHRCLSDLSSFSRLNLRLGTGMPGYREGRAMSSIFAIRRLEGKIVSARFLKQRMPFTELQTRAPKISPTLSFCRNHPPAPIPSE